VGGIVRDWGEGIKEDSNPQSLETSLGGGRKNAKGLCRLMGFGTPGEDDWQQKTETSLFFWVQRGASKSALSQWCIRGGKGETRAIPGHLTWGGYNDAPTEVKRKAKEVVDFMKGNPVPIGSPFDSVHGKEYMKK